MHATTLQSENSCLFRITVMLWRTQTLAAAATSSLPTRIEHSQIYCYLSIVKLSRTNSSFRICLPKFTDLSKINDLHVHSFPRRFLTMIPFKLTPRILTSHEYTRISRMLDENVSPIICTHFDGPLSQLAISLCPSRGQQYWHGKPEISPSFRITIKTSIFFTRIVHMHMSPSFHPANRSTWLF